MKQTTQKLLLMLHYAPEKEPLVALTAEQLLHSAPELSPSGFRSLLYGAVQNKYISKESAGQGNYYVSTDLGRRMTEASFPALSKRFESWSGEWSCMVFLEAHKGDPQFRYLRKLLLEKGAVALSRGVYLSAGEFDRRVQSEVETLYYRSVVVFTIQEWQIGSERPIVIDSLGLDSVAAGYSGISSEIAKLLSKNRNESKLNNQSKDHYANLIDRFSALLLADPGFTTRYFPGLNSPQNLLHQLQELIQL